MEPPVWIAVTAGVITLVGLVAGMRGRRHVIRRVGAVVARLDERPAGVEGGGGNLESALSRLERTADRTNTRLADARHEHDRLMAVLDALEEGVVLVNESGRVLYRNRVAAELGDEQGPLEGALRDLLRDAVRGVDARREVELSGAPRRSLVIHALPLAEAGGAAGAAAFIRDVSAHRRVDSLRRDFVGNVGRRLQGPIGALVALARVLEESDPAAAPTLSSQIRHQAQLVGRTVDDLLELSVLEAQGSPDRASVPAREVVSEALARMRERSPDRIDVAGVSDDVVISCDRGQVSAALAHLLDNAVRALPAGRHDLGSVSIDVRAEGEWAVFRVVDDGVGIPEADRSRIFERLYRVEREGDAGDGAGLGLALVRQVARVHGGWVDVESQEGVGSTFSLVLPLDPAAAR